MDPPNLAEFDRQILKLLIDPALKIADKVAKYDEKSFEVILQTPEDLKELKEFLVVNPNSSMMTKVTESFPEWTSCSKISYLYLELAHNDRQYLTPGMGVPYDMVKILEKYVEDTIKDANILVGELCGHENKLFAFIIQHAGFYVHKVRGGLRPLESWELD